MGSQRGVVQASGSTFFVGEARGTGFLSCILKICGVTWCNMSGQQWKDVISLWSTGFDRAVNTSL